MVTSRFGVFTLPDGRGRGESTSPWIRAEIRELRRVSGGQVDRGGRPRHERAGAGAGVAAREVAVCAVPALRAGQVVRQVQLVGLDGVPHGGSSLPSVRVLSP